jgi:Flp pilus assembly protein TadB
VSQAPAPRAPRRDYRQLPGASTSVSIRRRREAARVRRRQLLLIDVAIGAALALIALIVGPGLAMVALWALAILAGIAIWGVVKARRERGRRR